MANSNGIFGQVRSEFVVVGEVVDRRTVTSEKQKDWCLYILKVSAKGCTLEVRVTKEEYERAVMKQPYSIVGSITVENGRHTLLADQIQMLTASASRASA